MKYLKGQCASIVYACLYVIYQPVLLHKSTKLMNTCAITMEDCCSLPYIIIITRITYSLF